MALRVYLMPMTGTGTEADPRRPKYADTDLAGTNYATIDGGTEQWFLVAGDFSSAVQANLVAHADVTAAPADLSQQIGSSLSLVQNALESFRIPALWVTGTMTYQTVLRYVAAMSQYYQRLASGMLATYSLSQGGATGGTFTLTVGGQTTAPISAGSGLTNATLQSAIAALSTVGAGNVGASGQNGGPFVIAFSPNLGPVTLTATDSTSGGTGLALTLIATGFVPHPSTLFPSGTTLSTTFGSLPAATQTAMIAAATSLGYSTAGLTGATTLRAICKSLADQWPAVDSINMGTGVTF